MVFLDESGFLLQPLRRRVWAPSGHTPLQRAWDRRDRITTIAAVTRAPWALRLGLYYELLDHNARTADFNRFVREVHGHLRRPVILVWDRLPAHRSAARQLLEDAHDWLQVEWLPPYAPELDPVEDVWNQSKYGALANFIPEDIHELHSALSEVLDTFRHEPNRLHSFFDAAHLIL
ncbi:MAG: IS630 family transposase [Candidatus Binatia bacterium]